MPVGCVFLYRVVFCFTYIDYLNSWLDLIHKWSEPFSDSVMNPPPCSGPGPLLPKCDQEVRGEPGGVEKTQAYP